MTNIHMAKARRSKSKIRSSFSGSGKRSTNRIENVRRWTTKTGRLQIWKMETKQAIGELGRADDEPFRRRRNGYKSGKSRVYSIPYISPFSNFLSSSCSLLFSSKPCLAVMENQKKTYKQALFTSDTNQERKINTKEIDTSPKAEKAGDVSSEKQSSLAEKAFDWMDQTITKNVSGLGSFLQKLAKVEENIINLQKTTLFATFWKGAAENNRLKAKLRMEWQHIKGDFELIDRANNWYEVKFSNPIDKQYIWDHRPYYAFGNLLVLIPWKTNFDPLTTRLRTIDVWVRILFLPSEYITPEIVAAIIEHNDIGEFIRLDPYTESRTRTKYARVCVAINCTEKPKNFVVIPNAKGDYKIYKLWFEGVSEGCANCGAEEHQFELCPLRVVRNKMKENKKEKNMVRDSASDIHFSEESSVDKGKQKMEWNEVSYKKGKTKYTIHLEKDSNKMNEMNADNYFQTMQEYSQGFEDRQQMQQNENRPEQQPIFNQQNVFQNEDVRGAEDNFFPRKKTEDLDAESFKTGVAATTLTHDMEAIQVTEGNKLKMKKKRDNSIEAASSSSKRTRTNS